jgi:hypothetical protein
LNRGKVYERFKDSNRTVLNWLCVSFNEKEIFWKNLQRDYENDRLDCYEARLEEIINICMSVDRNY